MSALAEKVLSRFPAHLDAGRAGKRLHAVVTAIAEVLATVQAEAGGVRRAHRLQHAPTRLDLERIAALHGLGAVDFRVLVRRAEQVIEWATLLATGAAAPEREAAAAALLALWDLAPPGPPLAALAATAEEGAAAAMLATAARASVGHAALQDARRHRVAQTARVHAEGNGTVRALLQGAALLLDLDVDSVRNAATKTALMQAGAAAELDLTIQDELFHSADRFWHATFVVDRLAAPAAIAAVDPPDADGGEVLALEENPRRRAESRIGPVTHGQRFVVTRRGFVPQLLRVTVTGSGARTFGPHLVNRDQGKGVGVALAVPDATELVITEDGRAWLGGTDVTAHAFSWSGACFADAGQPHRNDFVFAAGPAAGGRAARFVVATPAGALDRDAEPPFGAGAFVVPPVGLGVTRFAIFVQVAHLSSRDPGAAAPRRVAPRTRLGSADHSVFAAAAPSAAPPAADLALSWLQHTPYAVRLYVPPRFAGLDDDGFDLRQTVRRGLDRFRAAGVQVEVVYQDEGWILGTGVLPGAGLPDPIARLRAGTRIAPAPAAAGAEQPLDT